MLLSARMLDNVGSVNNWDYANQVEFTEGDSIDIYFQLVDASKDRANGYFKPAGRRYAPDEDATLSVVLDNLDDDKKVTRTATQPFTQDPSIWKVTILSTDKVRGTANLHLTLTEGSKVTRGRADAVVLVHGQGNL